MIEFLARLAFSVVLFALWGGAFGVGAWFAWRWLNDRRETGG